MTNEQDLGMHVSSRSFKSSIREDRRRAFWALYSMENLLASNLGRPVSLPENQITQEYFSVTSADGLDGYVYIQVAPAKFDRSQYRYLHPCVVNSRASCIFYVYSG